MSSDTPVNANARSNAEGAEGWWIEHWMRRICAAYAICGGLIIVGLVILSIVSIVGRKVSSMPVSGDMEVLQMCAAVAVSTFFAYCSLSSGDIRVDFFTQWLNPKAAAKLDILGFVFLAAMAALILWRTAVGAIALKEVGETSPILAWPIWIAQALMVPGFGLLTLAATFMAVKTFLRSDI